MAKYKLKLAEKDYEVEVHEKDDERLEVVIDGEHFVVEASRLDVETAAAAPRARAKKRSHSLGAGGQVLAPMPGVVLELHVQVGDKVAAEARLLSMESMKMETAITAPSAGVVAKIHVAKGQKVAAGQALIDLET
ncbi:MAG: biotin/lipoyl-containing protein [Myxococcota bacterium]|jgi:biotin carboxyl carrier protein|nr:biotin/lipoyl-containing protein [Myxococcota bacterium]